MSTVLNTNGELLELPVVTDVDNFRVAVFTAEWNPEVTGELRRGVMETLRKAGVKDRNIISEPVPGTVELVNAAGMAVRMMPELSAVIVLGCVIRGDTPHFDYVCQIAAQGVATLNSDGNVPVIFGVLTVENQQQALDRAGGKLGNKGSEAAVAAIKMSNLHHHLAATRISR